MKSDLKQGWILALTNGMFKQGHGKFGRVITHEPETHTTTVEGVETTITTEVIEKEHCCLGVLLEILPTYLGVYPELQSVLDSNSLAGGSYDRADLEVLGIPSNVQDALITANDNKGEGSFSLIADLVAHLVPSETH